MSISFLRSNDNDEGWRHPSEYWEECWSNHQRRELHGLVLLSTQMCHTCVGKIGKFAKFCILGRLGSILRKRANEMKPNLRVPPSRYVGKLGGSASRVREGTSHSLLCSTLSTLPVWLFACNTHLTVLCSCHLLCPLLIFLSSAQSTPSRCNSNL